MRHRFFRQPVRASVAVVVLTTTSISAQANPTLPQLLERMSAYLLSYEQQLSSVVADERFEQRLVYTRSYRQGQPVLGEDRKRLESEVGFLRLPGGVEWLGFRDVRRVNDRAVAEKHQRIAELLASTPNVMVQARAIADASASHNLGMPRTTNVPTAALEMIHPRNHAAYEFSVRGTDSVRRTSVAVIGFTETRRPPIVRSLGGQELVSRGRIWIEPQSGTIWRVEWIYAPPVGSPFSLRVDFARNEALGMMVPVEMREEFPTFGGLNSRGDGVAVYTNFRRFGTGARIVPQP
jgi:hypothetical protein